MVCVKRADKSHIPDIVRLEREVFSDAWSEKGLVDTLCHPHAVIFGAWKEEELAGYIILYHVLDEGEIARIAAAPSRRRQGVGSALLGKVEEFCSENGITRLLLDVRESNSGAIAFYRRCGFARDGLRRDFYTAPKEDAVLMSRAYGKPLEALTAVSTRNREGQQI